MLRNLLRHITTAWLEHDAQGEREEHEQDHERNGHAEALFRCFLDRGQHGERRHVRDPPAGRVTRDDFVHGERDCPSVRLQEPPDEDLAGEIVEVVVLEPLDGDDGNTRRAGDLLHAHRPALTSLLQVPTD